MKSATALVIDACSEYVRGRVQGALGSELDSVLEEAWRTGVSAWPGIAVTREAFLAHIGAGLTPDIDVERSLRAIHAADLYLVLGAAAGDRKALAALEALFGALPHALSRVASQAPVDEIVQNVRARLLVPDEDGRLRILQFAGRGPLAGWLRVAAVREAISNARREKVDPHRPTAREALLDVPDIADNPEMRHLRDKYEAEFRKAFAEAVDRLAPDQRNLLRMSLVERLSIDEIGAVFHIHRATAARWIQKNLEQIREDTRAILATNLVMSDDELDSLMLLLGSNLDLSLSRLLPKRD